jgi:hypothetical protein
MGAVGEKTLEPGFGFRHGIRFGDSDSVETAGLRLRDKRGLDIVAVG